jgi:ketosteroid isomerase-like protein
MAFTLPKLTFFGLCLVLLPACTSLPPQTEAKLQREQVRLTETAFARTMANRDFDEFQSYLADEAIFLTADRTLNGKQQVAEAWQPLFQGDAAPFSWNPERVEVLSSGDLALSTGPVRSADGKQVATFTSIWRRGEDGQWKIVFDFGSE